MKLPLLVLAVSAAALLPPCVRAQAQAPEPADAREPPPAAAWWTAVAAGDVAGASAALERDANLLSSTNDRGETGLIVAAAGGHAALVRFLVERGAAVNVSDGRGRTALGRAVREGRPDVVTLLLAHGADAAARTPSGSTLLHDVPNAAIADLVIAAGAPVDAVNSAGVTPLHQAIFRGRNDVVGLLVRHGADVDARTGLGIGALHIAAAAQNLPAAQILLEAGAEVDAVDHFDGCTALAKARGVGSRELADLLLRHGARDDLPPPEGPDWRPAAPLPRPGRCEAFVLGGRLFVHHVPEESGGHATLHEFDETAQRWVTRATPPRRTGVAVEAWHDRLYAFGGLAGDGTPVAAVDRYDPVADAWTPVAPMPTARGEASSVVLGDEVYVIRGRGGASAATAVEAYDARADRWVRKASPPSAIGLPVVAGGRLYLIGGHDEKSGWTSGVRIYDPAADRWTVDADTPVPPWTLGAFVVGDRIYVICMRGNTVLEYRPDTATWTRKAPMPISRSDFSGTVVDGRIYIAGGHFGSPAVTASVECYDPARDAWRELRGLERGRWGMAIVHWRDRLHVLGGRLTGVDAPAPRPVSDAVETLDLAGLAP